MRNVIVASLVAVVCLAATAISQCPGGRCPLPGRMFRAAPVRQAVVQPAYVQASYAQPQVQVIPQPVQQSSTVVSGCPCGDSCPCLTSQPAPQMWSTAQAPTLYVNSSYGSTGSAVVSYGSTGSVASYDSTGSPVVQQQNNYYGRRYVRQTGGPTWTYSGNNLAAHLAQEHGVNAAGMSYSEMVAAHSDAHNGAIGYSNNTSSGFLVRRGPIRRLFGW